MNKLNQRELERLQTGVLNRAKHLKMLPSLTGSMKSVSVKWQYEGINHFIELPSYIIAQYIRSELAETNEFLESFGLNIDNSEGVKNE